MEKIIPTTLWVKKDTATGHAAISRVVAHGIDEYHISASMLTTDPRLRHCEVMPIPGCSLSSQQSP